LPVKPAPKGYYDISILKAPLWSGDVAIYFFLGGLSAGAYLVARAAERFGRGQFKDVTRAGALISMVTVLPSAPLLILDLGDPKRFHHMLRVWKPTSPMNLGSWTLTSYSPLTVLAGLRQLLPLLPARWRERLKVPAFLIDQTDLAGAPLAVGMAGYTGVLLSTTATPVWSKNPYIGALFSASALHTGCSAIALVLACSPETPGGKAVDQIDRLATLAELASLAGYLYRAGELAKPIIEGGQARNFWLGVVGTGLVLPTVIKRLPGPTRAKKVASAAAALAGALAMRWVFVQAGRASALDPSAARASSDGRLAE
jgi:formate-dependent nitrite reductase membrane component NrfD